jgi:ATP-dependent Clp protease protease subunit
LSRNAAGVREFSSRTPAVLPQKGKQVPPLGGPCLSRYNEKEDSENTLTPRPLSRMEREGKPAKGCLAMIDMTAPFRLDPKSQRGGNYARQRQMTLADLLMENRIIFLGTTPELGTTDPSITDYMANFTIQRLLYLQYENKNQEIHMYINSPGGSVYATLAIYDTMQFLECPIATYCMGLAASGAAILLAAGAKGKRYALPNSKIMIHQPWGEIGGQITDMEIQAGEFTKDRQRLNEILAKHCNQSVERIAQETERDRFFSAMEAKEFGLVDEVVQKK